MKLILLLSLFITMTYARQAPQQAKDACSHLYNNNSCHFISPHGKINGTCRKMRGNNTLVCVPNHHSRNKRSSTHQPHTRSHTVTQSENEVNTLPTTTPPITNNYIHITVLGDTRILKSNGIAKHLTGNFPNHGNPNSIKQQNYTFRVPANPQLTNKITPLGMHDFGLGINGVPFDPGAAEWYKGIRGSKWQYEALSGAVSLGLDNNHAHVQPTGAYHYHGVPSLLLHGLNVSKNKHSPLVGWAADGFPIYALYGYANPQDMHSNIIEISSSYSIRSGRREASSGSPGGYFDGTFVGDYVYIQNSGSLDECNGRFSITPEFPNGTYAYYLSNKWPVIPRCFKGTPSKDFTEQRKR